METIRRVAARLRPQLSFDGESFHVSLAAERPGEGDLPLLTDALDAVERLAEESEREVAVILDEVQQIVVEHGLKAERQLRSVVQRHRHVAYVFAGSSTRLLTQMTGDPDRPFYRLGSRLFLGPIPREGFREFLMRRFQETGLRLTDEAAAAILDGAEGVPYDVQRLAHATWEPAVGTAGADVDTRLVTSALRRMVLREDPAYTQLWTRLSTNQKKLLKAVIRARGLEVLAAEHTRALRIPTSSLRTALQTLEDAHVIRVDASMGQNRYRLVDPFLAGWLALSQST